MPNELSVEAVVPTLFAVCPPGSDGDNSSPPSDVESGLRVVNQTPLKLIHGRYRLDSVLAEGGMSIIYKAWHMTLDQPIAVKVLRPDYVDLPEAVERFQAEARALALLRGKHCVQVMDVGAMTDGTPFMVLELLEGCDLRGVLREQGPLTAAAATNFMLQAARAVSEVHALGLIHRDLKPDNLFLARQAVGKDVIKLIDFGISKSLLETSSHATQVDSCLGSPHFMSPEQVRSATAVDFRTDVWSLGAAFYELVTGRTPFQGNTLVSICASIICDEPPAAQRLRADLPAALEHVIMRCLMKDREFRYPSMQAIIDDLLQFEIDSIEVTLCSSGGTPLEIEAPASAPPTPASTWSSKRKVWAIATATLFSVGVSAAVVAYRDGVARAGTDESAAPGFGASADGVVAPKAQPSSERIASSVASDRPREMPTIAFEQLAEDETVVHVPSQNRRWRVRNRPTKSTPVRTGAARGSKPRAAQQEPAPVSDATLEARYGLSAGAR